MATLNRLKNREAKQKNNCVASISEKRVKMPALLSTLSDLFGTNNLYEVLEIKKDAELSEITRGSKLNLI